MSWPTLPHVRTHFLSADATLENVRRDFVEWHRGRPRYLLWALDVETPLLRHTLASAEQQLANLLLDDYRRQAHITVALRGFPSRRATADDDFGQADFDADLAALHAAAPPPFRLETGGLASFTSAPFLSVSDPDGGIARLRHALARDQAGPGGPYTPHVTVGLYAGAWPTREVAARLETCAAPAHALTVHRVALMAYAAADIGGPLDTLGSFDLARRHWDWHGLPPFDDI